MTKYFTIAAAGLTATQEKSLTETWAKYAWWHGIANSWLLRDHTDTFTAASVRDTIRAIAPNTAVMVVECVPTTWAGMSVGEPNREWLRKFWPPEGQ